MFFDRVSKFSRIINVSNITIRAKEKPRAEFDDHRRLHGDDIRAARYRESRGAAREGELTWTTTVVENRRHGCGVRCRDRRWCAAQGAPAVQPASPASPAAGHAGGAGADAPPAEAYTYDPAGRRDPFVSLLSRGHRTGARERN